MAPEITGQVNITNYASFNGNNETLGLIGFSAPLWKDASLSCGVGADINVFGNEAKINPAAEIKLKQKIGKYLNTQFRFREFFGEAEQYRVTFGGNYKFNDNWSIYGAVHGTAKNNDNWKWNTGGWIGATYTTKGGVDISAEFQQNIPLGKGADAKKALSSFNDGNKMVNVLISIPLK